MYYIEEMYRLWKEDPESVHPSWNVYFSGLNKGLRSEDAFRPPPSVLDLASISTEGNEISLASGSDTQDHMKVRPLRARSLIYGKRLRAALPPLDPTSCTSIPSSWSPQGKARPFRHSPRGSVSEDPRRAYSRALRMDGEGPRQGVRDRSRYPTTLQEGRYPEDVA